MSTLPQSTIKRQAIVLTDFRLPMLLATIQMHRQFPNSDILVHINSINNFDYGDYSSPWYKRLKLWIIRHICNVTIVNDGGEIEEQDFKGLNSSLISITNDSSASKFKYEREFKNLEKVASSSVGVADTIIQDSYDSVAIFNGRLASVFPIMRRCEKAGIPILYYEYGEQPFHFTLSRFRLHNFHAKAESAIALYENPELNSASFVAMKRVATDPHEKLINKFSKNLTSRCETTYDFCLFLGSPHEFLSLHEGEAATNLQIVNEIAASKKGLRGAVRAHPNQINDPSWRVESALIEAVCVECGFDYFAPDSKINSHDLIKNSDLTVVAGSSICVDSKLLGTPVEFASESLYSRLFNYVENTELNDPEAVTIMQLVRLTSNVWQLAYHPKYVILMRLIHFLDIKLTKTPFVGS